MNTVNTNKAINFLSELSANSLIDIVGLVTIEDIDLENAYDSIYEMIDDNSGFNVDIIYYSEAIKYLAENDPSLRESLELASNMGYEVKNLNSELLASLLASQNEREKFSELETEINDFFTELAETENAE